MMKNIQAQRRVVGSLLLFVACTSSFGSPLPLKSDSAASPLSEKPIQAGRYEIRLPKGYSEKILPPEIAAKILARRKRGFDDYLYSGNRRTDGTAATLGLEIVTQLSSMLPKLSLEQVTNDALSQKKRTWHDFYEGPKHLVQVNGIAVEWVPFSGLVSGHIGTIKASGVIYAAIDGNNVINIQAEDAEVYSKESLPILQAAVLTFHHQKSK